MLTTAPVVGTRSVTGRIALILLLILIAASPLTAQTTIATVGLSTGWATFGEAVPQGLAVNGLRVGSLVTQTDVKNRWPDGSIRFAVLTVNVPTAGAYAVTAVQSGTTPFAPSLPTASVRLTIGGVLYTAALPATASADAWLSGPLAYEGRSVVTPTAGTPHPFLRVVFDTRVYNDGKGRVDVTVENVLDKTGATTVTYDVSILVNGQTVFTKAAVSHYYLTRWRKIFPVGGVTFATITPDMAPFNVSRAIPKFLSLVANQVSTPTGVTYDILREGALDSNMPAHGGRAELAPYPDWTARYLVHKDPTQRTFVLANGDLSGSWPVHLREAETGTSTGVGTERLVSLDQRPTLWYDARAKGDLLDYVKGSPMPIQEYGSLTPGPGQSPLIPDDAHQPSIAYVPYLLTGDRYYAEEMAFWGNYGMIRTYPADGVRGGQGILAYNEVRGYAWALRNLVEAAAYYPDGPVKTYLSSKAMSNLQWLDAFANAQDPAANPFKVLWLGKRPDGNQFIAMWEQNYLAYAIDRANKLGFAAGLAHRDAIAKFQLRLFNSEPAYPRAQGAPYIVGVGTWGTGTLYYDSYAQFTFHQTMAQVWTATQGNERPFGGYYGPEARLNLMMGVESGWSGAQAAYDYLWPFIGVQPFWGALPDLAQRAGWALDFYPAGAGAPTGPLVVLDKPRLQFGVTTSGTAFATNTPAQVVRLLQSGTGTVTWTAAASQPWLTVSPASGSGSATFTVSVKPGAGVPAMGSVTGAITFNVVGASNSPGSVIVTLSTYPAGTSGSPFGQFETPLDLATGLNGSIPVTGWALDDVVVSAVRIMRDPIAPEPPGAPLFVGTATFIEGARPDVAATFPAYPMESRGGWGYLLLTNQLPGHGNGTFKFYAYADDVEGHSTLLGTRVVTLNNASALTPFGAIDTPSQGGVVSGIVNNFGWVLSPGSGRADVPGGGTVTVFIDGNPVGTPGGWASRSDIVAAFPVAQYSGVNSALAVYTFDSNTLTNGVHTISWSVRDNKGQQAGVGSRFFSVWNGAGLAPALTMSPETSSALSAHGGVDALPGDTGTMRARRGLVLDVPAGAIESGTDGRFTVTGEELDRFELQIGDRPRDAYTGYLRTSTGLAPLPTGSRLDADTQTFTWQTGPGFVGRYDLVFVRSSAGEAVSRRDVTVILQPKGFFETPRIVIETPTPEQSVAGSFTVTGWAVDPRSSRTGVDTVHVWAYPEGGADPVFLGAAVMGFARTDVAAIFGDRARDSGYELFVRGLPPGRYTLAVFPRSTVIGDFLAAGTTPVIVR